MKRIFFYAPDVDVAMFKLIDTPHVPAIGSSSQIRDDLFKKYEIKVLNDD